MGDIKYQILKAISGQPNAPTGGTWNPGLDESLAVSPGASDPLPKGTHHQGDPNNGDSRQNRTLSEEGGSSSIPEEETDSETEPAMNPGLQRQQSSRLLLDKVRLA